MTRSWLLAFGCLTLGLPALVPACGSDDSNPPAGAAASGGAANDASSEGTSGMGGSGVSGGGAAGKGGGSAGVAGSAGGGEGGTSGSAGTGNGGSAGVAGSAGGGEGGTAGSAGVAGAAGAAGGGGSPGAQIIADHSIVDRYDDIPPMYIAAVKKMWFNIIGESHSTGYLKGLTFLAAQDPNYAVVAVATGAPPAYQEGALRVSRSLRNQYNNWSSGGGEAVWYTNAAGMTSVRNHIDYCEGNSLHIAAIAFGWCWDMTWHNGPGGTMDPVHKVRWAGSSEGGPDGDLRWGLDDNDLALTGNHVSMQTYLDATRQYGEYCTGKSYTTKVLYTTGPVDGYSGESGVQRQIKHDAIRQYVLADSSRILFDYADILAWSNANTQNLQSWTDTDGNARSYQMIHADNMLELDGSPHVEDGDHIGGRGALRLGKAVWWLMARLAGWNGQ